MSLTDPMGDMLTVLRNANRAGHESANVKRSKSAIAVLNVLKKENFIFDFKTVDEGPQGFVRVFLKAPEGVEGRRVRKMINIQRVSRPGLRRYARTVEIPRVLNGLGVCVVSTPKGVMTGHEARRQKVGGEVLLKIW